MKSKTGKLPAHAEAAMPACTWKDRQAEADALVLTADIKTATHVPNKGR
jgi:hypothetical protein